MTTNVALYDSHVWAWWWWKSERLAALGLLPMIEPGDETWGGTVLGRLK